jgi:multiple sugar transport system ATP-binding protein
VAGRRFPGPRATRDRIEFAIRPEDLVPGDDGIPATVRVVEPLGPHTLVTTEVDGALFRAVLDSNVHPNPGDRLAFAPTPDRIRWFDPDTQEALA